MDRRARFPLVVGVMLACGGRSNLDSSNPAVPDAGVGVASISPSTVDFGLVSCGAVAPAQVVAVANTGTAEFSFTAALALGANSPYTFSPTSDIVAPGGTVQIVIWPSDIPQTSDVTPNLYGDTLTIQTTVKDDPPHVVPIIETARGAILTWSTGISFGKRFVGTQVVLPLTITNDGDLDAKITLTTSPPFATTSEAVIVAAKSTTSVGIGYTPDPARLGVQAAGQVTMTTDTLLCGALPGAVVVSGTANDSAKAIGGAFGPTMCALGQSGNLYCWGQGNGALGNGTTAGSATPVLSLATGAQSIAGAWSTICVGRTGGGVQCWGSDAGLLGNGTTNTSTTPVNVAGINDAKRVIGGGEGALCTIRQTGQIACWGYNTSGKFGAGYAPVTESTPITAFGGVSDVVDAVMGPNTACIVRSGGGVQCAGSASEGMLGVGNNWSDTNTPVNVIGINTAVGIGMSFYNSCAVLSSGDVECWGNGYYGNLGNGTNGVAFTPVFVSNLHDAVAVSGGYGYMCALRSTGEVACWGENWYGNLGNGSTSDANVPVKVSGITAATEVVAGVNAACALLANGSILCWGDGTGGGLGNGSYATSPSPVAVVGFN